MIDERWFYANSSEVGLFVLSPKKWFERRRGKSKSTPQKRGIVMHNFVFRKDRLSAEMNLLRVEDVSKSMQVRTLLLREFGNGFEIPTKTSYSDKYKLKGRPDAVYDGIPIEVKFHSRNTFDEFQCVAYSLLYDSRFSYLLTPEGLHTIKRGTLEEIVSEASLAIFYAKKVFSLRGKKNVDKH